MNAVLSNYCQRYGAEGHIIVWDTTYGSVKSMARHYGRHGRVTEIPFLSSSLTKNNDRVQYHDDYYYSPASILAQALQQHVPSHPTSNDGAPPPLMILDHITSNTALTWDVALAARMARTYVHPDAWIVVDGAHGLWTQDLAPLLGETEEESRSIDVYLTNGHKWLAAPRGVALAWSMSDAATQTLLSHPAVLSHGMHEPDLFSRFVWDGCRDYSAALAVPAVLEYWQEEGITNGTTTTTSRWVQARRHVHELLWQGLALLAHQWHGMPADNVPLLQQEGFDRGLLLAPYDQGWLQAPMALMRVPPRLETVNDAQNTSDDAKRLQDYLYDNQVEVPIKCIEGKLYVRVSCHVYNRLQDFERLGKVLQK